jgi:hypothetical protein
MKLRSLLFVLIASFIIGGAAPVYAEDVVPTRAEEVAVLQVKYAAMFDTQYARFLALKPKLVNDASSSSILKSAIIDFLEVRSMIEKNLVDPNTEVSSTKAYASEEFGEFEVTLGKLEYAALKNKLITCVKGKNIKKIAALKPVCPKGYTKKK